MPGAPIRALRILVALTLLQTGLVLGQSKDQDKDQDQSSPPAVQLGVGQGETPVRVRVSSGVSQGLLIRKVAPEYPKKARRKHIQGTVIMKAKISKEGDITDLELVAGDPMLAQAAMDAVKQWKYRPYLLKGEPVEVETQIQVNFTLSGG